MSFNKPKMIEKIKISPKRMLYVKLWGPSSHSKYGMMRSSIEIQEAKFSDEKQVSYSTPIRIPCDGAAALLSNLISHFIIEGRQLNNEYSEKSENNSEQSKKIMNSNQLESHDQQNQGENLESLLLREFKGKKISKTRILSTLNESSGIEIDNNHLMEILEFLASKSKIEKESAVHSASGTKYTLWVFPN